MSFSNCFGFRVGSSGGAADPPGFILKKRGDLRSLQDEQVTPINTNN